MPVSPSHNRESQGQTLVGICAACSTETKLKDTLGLWQSQCAHPSTMYKGTLRKGGKKKIPNIPPANELMHASGVVDGALAKAQEPVSGMIDPNEPRDDEERAPATEDSVDFDVQTAMSSIALHARGMARALMASQKRVVELEVALVEQMRVSAKLREQIEELEADDEGPGEQSEIDFDPDEIEF